MTEAAIQYWLFRELSSAHRLIVPNYTPSKWFECDLFSVTKAGFFQEHEVKLTPADYAKDAGKASQTYLERHAGRPPATKHSRLEAGDISGPAAFYFVVPEEMAEISVPAFAGLKVAKDYGHFWRTAIVKAAPRLHSEKASGKVLAHAAGVCYWRFWRERHRVMQLAKRLKTTPITEDSHVPDNRGSGCGDTDETGKNL